MGNQQATLRKEKKDLFLTTQPFYIRERSCVTVSNNYYCYIKPGSRRRCTCTTVLRATCLVTTSPQYPFTMMLSLSRFPTAAVAKFVVTRNNASSLSLWRSSTTTPLFMAARGVSSTIMPMTTSSLSTRTLLLNKNDVVSSSSQTTTSKTTTVSPVFQGRSPSSRHFSSNSSFQSFQPKSPNELNLEMTKGIQSTNLLFIRHGVGKQRLQALANDPSLSLTMKWQYMMETYLTCQLHVVSGLGFTADEKGLMEFTSKLGTFISSCSPSVQEEFRTVGRDTWREMLSIAFELDDIILEKFHDELSIVDARNIMHQVASQLVEPKMLEMVATKCSQLPHEPDTDKELAMKHHIIQDVVVNQVYLGGDDPNNKGLVETLGFGSGPKGTLHSFFPRFSRKLKEFLVGFSN